VPLRPLLSRAIMGHEERRVRQRQPRSLRSSVPPLRGFILLAVMALVVSVSGNAQGGYGGNGPHTENSLRHVAVRNDLVAERSGKHVEFWRWSTSSTLVNMCACEGPPDSILQFQDSVCEAVEIYQDKLTSPAKKGASDSAIFAKAFCTGMGEDVNVQLFQDDSCTKRLLRYSSAWEKYPKPSACDSSKTFTNYFGSPVPTCASMFRCVGYSVVDLQ